MNHAVEMRGVINDIVVKISEIESTRQTFRRKVANGVLKGVGLMRSVLFFFKIMTLIVVEMEGSQKLDGLSDSIRFGSDRNEIARNFYYIHSVLLLGTIQIKDN